MEPERCGAVLPAYAMVAPAPLFRGHRVLGVAQERDVHQPRVRRVEDCPVLLPASLAEQPENNADDNEHEEHDN